MEAPLPGQRLPDRNTAAGGVCECSGPGRMGEGRGGPGRATLLTRQCGACPRARIGHHQQIHKVSLVWPRPECDSWPPALTLGQQSPQLTWRSWSG